MSRARKVSPEVKAAWIGGAFTLLIAAIGVVTTWAMNTDKVDVEISGFSLNVKDTLYECDPCSFLARRAGAIPYIKRTPIWQMTINLMDGQDMWGDTNIEVDDPAYVGFDEKFKRDPTFYISKLNPVFDMVVNNFGTGTAVLTEIEARVARSDPSAVGDGVEARSGPLRPQARYRIEISSVNDECCTNIITLDDPLSIRPSDPVRFQVEIFPERDAYQAIYEMNFVLWFGDKFIETDMFIVEM